MDFLSTSIKPHHGFVGHNKDIIDKKYFHFRKKIQQELNISITFYVVEQCLNHFQTFIWNFAIEDPTGLEKLRQNILSEYLNNLPVIKYCLKNFQEDFYNNIKDKMPVFDIGKKQQLLEQKNTISPNLQKIRAFFQKWSNLI